MPKSVSTSLQRGLLAVLCLTALAGIAQSAFWRDMPAAFEPQLDSLEIDGHQTQPLQRQAARSDASYAYSTLREWQVQSTQEPDRTMRITLVGVHSRSDKGLGIENLASHPTLAEVEERRTVVAEQGNIIGTATSIGRSGEEVVLQTCLPAGGHAHVVMEELAQTITAQRTGGWMNQVQRIFGLKPNIRWECLLVSISTPHDAQAEAALMEAWSQAYWPLRIKVDAAMGKASS